MSARPVSLGDLNIKTKEKGITHALVVDGKVSEFNLKLVNKSHRWLQDEIMKHNCRLDEIFLLTIDDSGNINLIKNGDTK